MTFSEMCDRYLQEEKPERYSTSKPYSPYGSEIEDLYPARNFGSAQDACQHWKPTAEGGAQ